MSPAAGQLLIKAIVPLLNGVIGRGGVKPTGCEDIEELKAEGRAMAAALLDTVESKGKTVTPGNIAYYTLQALKSGRRSGYTGRMDAMCPAAALEGKVQLTSMDAAIGPDNEDPDQENSLHDVLAASGEDAGADAGRRCDWDDILPRLDIRRRTILTATAQGRGPGEIAGELNVTAPRVCQLRESIGKHIVDAWGSSGLATITTPPQWKAGMRAAAERRAGRYERHATA
jgi:hypothetical protein